MAFVLLPSKAHRAFQNLPVNRGSRSCTTARGTPYMRTTFWKNRCATRCAVRCALPIRHGISFTSLVRRSTHVNTQLNPWMRGKSVMKSMLHSLNLSVGIGSGYISPGGRWVLSFTRLQILQFRTYWDTSCRMRGHHTRRDNNCNVRLTPGCNASALAWHSSRTSWRHCHGSTSCSTPPLSLINKGILNFRTTLKLDSPCAATFSSSYISRSSASC